MFDLDYTLLRPSDQFEAPGYVRAGARFGLELDAGRWPRAERAAYAAAKERRLRIGEAHDDGLLAVIAHAIIEGLGGGPPHAVEETAAAIAAAWSRAENFGLYDDVMPCLRALRDAGVRAALVSNALGHSLEEVVAHFALDDFICASVSSADVGVVKPAAAMFETMLERLDVAPQAAVMVGDSAEDDVSGALACGCGAILLDRGGRAVGAPLPRIESLTELPAALSL
ncbi:MAG: HAD family hydrolase [Actinobacteria bacterium]|nr:HAD family hydrolase [Actinomycetota bacterium]